MESGASFGPYFRPTCNRSGRNGHNFTVLRPTCRRDHPTAAITCPQWCRGDHEERLQGSLPDVRHARSRTARSSRGAGSLARGDTRARLRRRNLARRILGDASGGRSRFVTTGPRKANCTPSGTPRTSDRDRAGGRDAGNVGLAIPGSRTVESTPGPVCRSRGSRRLAGCSCAGARGPRH